MDYYFCFPIEGHEEDDHRLMITGETASQSGSLELNTPGLYPSTCVEIALDGLAVTAVLQANHVNDYEGGSGTSISFDYAPQVHLDINNCVYFMH